MLTNGSRSFSTVYTWLRMSMCSARARECLISGKWTVISPHFHPLKKTYQGANKKGWNWIHFLQTNHWRARARKQDQGTCAVREMDGEKGMRWSISCFRLREREGPRGKMSLQKLKKKCGKEKNLGGGVRKRGRAEKTEELRATVEGRRRIWGGVLRAGTVRCVWSVSASLLSGEQAPGSRGQAGRWGRSAGSIKAGFLFCWWQPTCVCVCGGGVVVRGKDVRHTSFATSVPFAST